MPIDIPGCPEETWLTDKTFLIIGAGMAGAKAAETLREEGFDGRIVMLGSEAEPPYERPPLSKGYLLGDEPREGSRVHDEGYYDEHSIELEMGVTVTRLLVEEHKAELDDRPDRGLRPRAAGHGRRAAPAAAPGRRPRGRARAALARRTRTRCARRSRRRRPWR